LKDTRTPVLVGAAAMGLNVIFSLTFVRLFAGGGWRPHGGLALANSLATALEMGALILLLRGRLGGLASGAMAGSLWRSIAAAAGMGLAVAGWARVVTAPLWLAGPGGALLGAGVYFLLAYLLRSPEMKSLRRGALS
jgi:putative peptidoglycan lipid II flippase